MGSFSQCGSNLTFQLYCLPLLPSSHTRLWWFPKLMSYLENSYSSFRTQSVPPLYLGLIRGGPFCCSSQFPSLRPGRWGETQCNPAEFCSSGPTCDDGNLSLLSNVPSSIFLRIPRRCHLCICVFLRAARYLPYGTCQLPGLLQRAGCQASTAAVSVR